jgi:hypothetical protein
LQGRCHERPFQAGISRRDSGPRVA